MTGLFVLVAVTAVVVGALITMGVVVLIGAVNARRIQDAEESDEWPDD